MLADLEREKSENNAFVDRRIDNSPRARPDVLYPYRSRSIQAAFISRRSNGGSVHLFCLFHLPRG